MAYRSGDGVPYEDYGPTSYEGQEAFTRPLFTHLLGQEWLPAVTDVHERLRAEPPARVADVACGCGWSSIAIARAYPLVHVDGVDLDTASIEKARKNLAGSDVEDRVTFHERDAADPALAGQYDLVTIFEALHDMSYPVDVLRALRGMLADGGSVIVGDERTEDSFQAPASELERLYYGFSILHCLPVGMVGEDPAGTGTVMRTDTVRRLRRGGWVHRLRGAADRERLLALLPAYAVQLVRRQLGPPRADGLEGVPERGLQRLLVERRVDVGADERVDRRREGLELARLRLHLLAEREVEPVEEAERVLAHADDELRLDDVQLAGEPLARRSSGSAPSNFRQFVP